MRSLAAGRERFAGGGLAGSCGIFEAVSRSCGCGSVAAALAGDRRHWAGPVRSRAVWDAYFAVTGARSGSAFDVDGSIRWRLGGIRRRRVGTSGNGGDGFVFVIAVAFSAHHGASADAAQRFSADLGVSDFSDVGAVGMDKCGSGVVRDRRNFARLRLCAAGARFRDSRRTAVLGACVAESEAGAARAILDLNSGVHFERGEFGNPRAGRGRADAVVGKFIEGTGRPGLSGDIVSTCALEAGRGGGMSEARLSVGKGLVPAERRSCGSRSVARFGAYVLFCICLLLSMAVAQGELRFCLRSEPKTFDPLKVEDDASVAIRYLTGGVLVRMNRQTQALEPELAESWKVSKDGKQITFKLRSGVSFSDGTPFSAEDVAYTVQQLMDPALHSPTGDSFRSGPGNVETKVISPTQISITFPAAVAGLDRQFDQVAILSQHSPKRE